MKEIAMMLNNYFNDMFVSIAFLTALIMYWAQRYALKRGEAARALVSYLYGRLSYLFVSALLVATVGAVLRLMEGSELKEMSAKGFEMTLMVKYVLLLLMLLFSVRLWARVRRGMEGHRRASETA